MPHRGIKGCRCKGHELGSTNGPPKTRKGQNGMGRSVSFIRGTAKSMSEAAISCKANGNADIFDVEERGGGWVTQEDA